MIEKRKRRPKENRLQDDVWLGATPEPNTGCWLWTMSVNKSGYGQVCVDGYPRLAHRHFYMRLRGSIPDGMQLDHLCRTPACVNPDHLEPVTPRENTRRGEVCKSKTACHKCGGPLDFVHYNKQKTPACKPCFDKRNRDGQALLRMRRASGEAASL